MGWRETNGEEESRISSLENTGDRPEQERGASGQLSKTAGKKVSMVNWGLPESRKGPDLL